MNVNTMLALGIMWKGMLGIFVVMGILALVVYLLTKVSTWRVQREVFWCLP